MTSKQYEASSGQRGAVVVHAGENISLKEALEQWTVTELRSLASAYSVKAPSKLRKEPLIDAVASALLERDRMREVLLALEPEDWGLFHRTEEAGTYRPKQSEGGCGLALQRLGYLCRIRDGGKESYTVPEEVRAVYRELAAEGFCTRKERADLIHRLRHGGVQPLRCDPAGGFDSDLQHAEWKKDNGRRLFSVLLRIFR